MSVLFNVKYKLFALQILFLILVSSAFGYLIIQNFSTTLTGGGDFDLWEYVGFYFAKNLSLLPVPHLNLLNDQTLYPYGTNTVFQPWSIERDSFYAVMYSLFGIGPWLQLYYLMSVVFGAWGTFALLVRDYGFYRATSAGILMSFGNFYAIYKYPHHLNIAVIHWLTFNIIVDFLIVRRVYFRQYVSLKLILFKICLVVLLLGSELGYLAGLGFTSITICSIFIILILGSRYIIAQEQNFTRSVSFLIKNYRDEFLNSIAICLTLLTTIFITSCYYLPLIWQIAIEVNSFDFTGVNTGAWWANPLRLLIPYLPGINPGQLIFERLMHDSPEGLGAASPGWFLIIIGTIGLWQSRRQITIFIPLIIIFLLCLFYEPRHFPILKIFPWFTFNRVGGRATVIYPVILTLFALHYNSSRWRSLVSKSVTILLISLACTEFYTAYSLKIELYQPYIPDRSFFDYMSFVKQQPGEAVLDWPFCVAGGNGVGTNELCPYFHKNNGVSTFKRFHQKKVVGYSYSRLHPSQIEPYMQAGWSKLFFPDSADIIKATQQRRCFRADEWSFFTDFYNLNDFAGINLYPDLLPKNCVNEFYRRFGTPTIETKIVDTGRVQFIAKPPHLREKVNIERGRTLKFEPYLDTVKADLLTTSMPYSLLKATGLSIIETNQHDKWRWGLGSETQLSFKLHQNQPLQLNFNFTSLIDNQSVNVKLNGILVEAINLNKNDVIDKNITVQGIAGLNDITFNYKDWNKNGVEFAPKDSRLMAIRFTKLAISTRNNVFKST